MKEQETTKLARVGQLFWTFFTFGCFTFGGGWSIVAQMEKKYIDKEKVLPKERLLDMIAVARSIPGIMITNITFLFGYHMEGLPGALACLFGIVIPPVLILMAIATVYSLLNGNPIMLKAMAGVRTAVVPIILTAFVKLWGGAFKYKPCYAIMVLSFVLYWFFHVSIVPLVLLGGLCGLALCELIDRREMQK